MRLHPLLAALDDQPTFKSLVDALRSPDSSAAQILSVIPPARPYALAAMHAALGRPMLLVVGRPSEARAYANEPRAWPHDPDSVGLRPELHALTAYRLH